MTNEEAIAKLKEDIDLYIPTSGTIEEVDRELPDGRLITALEMAIDALEKQANCDCVSRQAVLDKAKYWIAIKETGTGIIEKRGYFVLDDDVKELPSVIPQPTRWIPVSERLPRKSDIVLLSLPPHIDPNGEECCASVICGHYIGGRTAEWGLSDGDTFGYGIVSIRKGISPIAWMPLPLPYKTESEESK